MLQIRDKATGKKGNVIKDPERFLMETYNRQSEPYEFVPYRSHRSRLLLAVCATAMVCALVFGWRTDSRETHSEGTVSTESFLTFYGWPLPPHRTVETPSDQHVEKLAAEKLIEMRRNERFRRMVDGEVDRPTFGSAD